MASRSPSSRPAVRSLASANSDMTTQALALVFTGLCIFFAVITWVRYYV